MSRVRDDLEKYLDCGVNVSARTVDLTGEISDDTVKPVIRGLHMLAVAKADPITLLINSPGGNWYAGMALYDFIRGLDVHVTAKVYGQAMSMASVILQAADERMAAPHATIMVHHGSNTFDGHAVDYELWADASKRARGIMCGIYAQRSGKPAAYWNRKCMHDYILTADQALLEGLLDGILPDGVAP